MSESLVLEPLRAIRADIARVDHKLDEHGERLTRVELGLAAVRREIAVLAEADAHLGVRMDRMEARLERIERRLDLVEP